MLAYSEFMKAWTYERDKRYKKTKSYYLYSHYSRTADRSAENKTEKDNMHHCSLVWVILVLYYFLSQSSAPYEYV